MPKAARLTLILAMLLFALCGVFWAFSTFKKTTYTAITIQLYHAGGDINLSQRDALLQQPWQVTATYSPTIEIPYLTAKWSTCGFFSWPCLYPYSEEYAIPQNQISHSTPNTIVFKLPEQSPKHGYTLDNLRIALPQNITVTKNELETNQLPSDAYIGSVDVNFGKKIDFTPVKLAPIVFEGNFFVLAGQISSDKLAFQSPTNGETCDIDNGDLCAFQNTNTKQYVFKQHSKYSQYQSQMSYRTTQTTELKPPYPVLLQNEKRQNKNLIAKQKTTMYLHGHRFDSIIIESFEDNPDICHSYNEVEIKGFMWMVNR